MREGGGKGWTSDEWKQSTLAIDGANGIPTCHSTGSTEEIKIQLESSFRWRLCTESEQESRRERESFYSSG